jgi:hypothetical protein
MTFVVTFVESPPFLPTEVLDKASKLALLRQTYRAWLYSS